MGWPTTSIPRGAIEKSSLLVCRLASSACGIPIEHVVETMRPLPIAPLSEMPTFVLGVSIVRGIPTPVIDLRKLLAGSTEAGAPARFVTVRTGPRPAALAVDEVLGALAPAAESFGQLSPLLGEANGKMVAAVGKLDGRLLFILETARLVPDAAWKALAQRESRS